MTWRNHNTQELWRLNSLVAGLAFLIRYTLQMKDHLLEIREHQILGKPATPTIVRVQVTGYSEEFREEFLSDLVINESTFLVAEPTIPMV